MPKKTKMPKVYAAKPSVPSEAAKAYAAVGAEIAQLAPDALVPVNIDIPRAVAVAIGAVPHLAKLRDAAATMPDFDIANIDRIGTYALAAWYAHLLALPDVRPGALTALLDEAKPLREHMLLAAELLVHAAYFDKGAVEAVRAGQGNLDTANDLVALAALFTAGWKQVENRSTVRALSPCSRMPTTSAAAPPRSSAGTRATSTTSPRPSTAAAPSGAPSPRPMPTPRATAPRSTRAPSRPAPPTNKPPRP
jgi:hypothetical protein